MDLIHYELLYLTSKFLEQNKMEINICIQKRNNVFEVEIGKDGPQMLEVKMFIIKKYSYSIICTCEYDIFIFKKVQLTL